VCGASQDKIAKELGISRRSVIRHIAILVKDEYLVDLTPEIKHAPHEYDDTGKACLKVQLVAGVTESHSRCDRESQLGVTESHSKIQLTRDKLRDKDICEISVEPEPEGDDMNSDEYKKRIAAAMERGAAKQAGRESYDLEKYPADVKELLAVFCETWNIRPPALCKDKSAPSSDWIRSARYLLDACGEFGVEAITAHRKWFDEEIVRRKGIIPYSVTRPGSLINPITGFVATLRSNTNPADDKVEVVSPYGYKITARRGEPVHFGDGSCVIAGED
jgi:DNA-binding Lrp family transcriptional regulator